MSIYAIKDKDGELRDSAWDSQNATGRFCAFTNISVSDTRAKTDKHPGCSVVRLVEQPKPVEVSDVAGGWLTDMREEITRGGSVYTYVDMLKSEHEMSIEDIFHALDVGWTVDNPKRYVLPIPGTDYHNNQMHGNAKYYAVKGTGNWRPDAIALGTDDAVKHGYTVTKSDIDAAPDWVKTITPVEVTNDEN